MKLNKVLLGAPLAAGAFIALAAQSPAPVIDVSGANNNLPQASVTDRLSSLERKLDARNRAQVTIQRQLNELQDEVNELRGVTELHTHQLSQILDRQRELYQEIDRRMQSVNQAASAPVPATIAAPNVPASATPQVSYSDNLTENEAYDRAVNMVLKDKRYEQAIPEFRAFNKKYPNSTYAANAHYWLGQLLFNKGELAEAKLEFEVVVNQFQDSNKRSDALLKLAMVAQKQSDNARAIVLYRQVIEQYPNTSAAQLAKPRLASISQ